MERIDNWTAGALIAFMGMWLVMIAGSVQGAPSSSPGSISIEDLEPGDNQSQTITIYVTGSDNLTAVQLLITGDTALDETALQDMVSIYPTYFSFLDNTENKTFTVNVMNVGYDGDYDGDIVISHSAGDNNIPLSIDAGSDIPEITGLIPSKGTIVATMTALDSIQKNIDVYNQTDYNLSSFDAYMADTQLYGGADWITVSFEAPYLLKVDNYTTISLSIDPSEVPDNVYDRTLVIDAYHSTTRVYAEVNIRITIYGGNNLLEGDVELVVNPIYPLVGENLTISLSHAVEADIWIGANYIGKTDDNGQLTTSVSDGGEYEAVAMIGGRSIATKQVTIREQASVAIQLDSLEVQVGDWVRGTVVTTEGIPVANIRVTLNSSGAKSTSTDSLGRFNILTDGVVSGSHLIETEITTIGHVSYGKAETDVLLLNRSNWASWAAAIALTAVSIVTILMKRELIRQNISRVSKKFGTQEKPL